jgi:hypothetical protein
LIQAALIQCGHRRVGFLHREDSFELKIVNRANAIQLTAARLIEFMFEIRSLDRFPRNLESDSSIATKAGFHVAVMLRGAAVCPCKLLKRIRNVCDKQQYEIVAG